MTGARPIIEGPVFTGLPYGLWDSIQHPDFNGPHWQNGVTWQDFCPSTTGDTVYNDCLSVTGVGGSPPPMSSLTANVTRTDRGATPFTLYAEFDASPVGLDAAGTRAQAEYHLGRVEDYALEHAFWTGQAGGQQVVWPHLAANAALLDPNGITLQTAASAVVTGTGTDVVQALGQVEGALATCYGGQGVIHIPRLAVPAFDAWDLIKDDGTGKLYTKAGNLVVLGGGYPGSSPAGAVPAAPLAWIYATGQVFGFRSDVMIRHMPETFDRSANTERRQALRTYVLGFECCLIAAQINVSVPFA